MRPQGPGTPLPDVALSADGGGGLEAVAALNEEGE